MCTTRNFKELVRHQMEADPAFAEVLSLEIEKVALAGDVDSAEIMRRDYLEKAVNPRIDNK